MRLLRFLISRVFWVQLGLAAVLGLVGFVALNVGLRGFTRHSERIAVPSVVGFDRAGAEVALEAAGLRPVVIDSLYNAKGQPGAVVEQDPAAGVLSFQRRSVGRHRPSISPSQTEFLPSQREAGPRSDRESETGGLRVRV